MSVCNLRWKLFQVITDSIFSKVIKIRHVEIKVIFPSIFILISSQGKLVFSFAFLCCHRICSVLSKHWMFSPELSPVSSLFSFNLSSKWKLGRSSLSLCNHKMLHILYSLFRFTRHCVYLKTSVTSQGNTVGHNASNQDVYILVNIVDLYLGPYDFCDTENVDGITESGHKI